MATIRYFAYGSNLSTPRLLKRTPSARKLYTGYIAGHTLKFHKVCPSGSGKCDILETGEPEDRVYGVVYGVAEDEMPVLDCIEGLGEGYERKWVNVVCGARREIRAATYYAIMIDPGVRPYDWYKTHVLQGAREHGLPEDYIRLIKVVESMPDPDPDIHLMELSIYGSYRKL